MISIATSPIPPAGQFLQQQPQQLQFPPPPPYSANATVTTAAPSSTTRAVIDVSSCSPAELQKALMEFRNYKKALASTLWFASFMTLYLFFLVVTFQETRLLFFTVMIPCIVAIFGVINKQTLLLFPLLVEELIAIGTFTILLVLTVALSVMHPTAWDIFVKHEFEAIMNFFGINSFQMTMMLIVFFFLELICIWIVTVDLLDAINMMPKYCEKVHKIALRMVGLSTDLKDPELIRHLQFHIAKRTRNGKKTCA